MLVAIKKCKFFTKKTDFVRFIIKLGYSKLARTRERYIVKIVFRVLQLL